MGGPTIYEGSLKDRYFERFNCDIHIEESCAYDLVYEDLTEYIKNGEKDEDLIVTYDASNIKGDWDDLMQRSLDTGVDLMFEQVKDKKIDANKLKKLRDKAWEELKVIIYGHIFTLY